MKLINRYFTLVLCAFTMMVSQQGYAMEQKMVVAESQSGAKKQRTETDEKTIKPQLFNHLRPDAELVIFEFLIGVDAEKDLYQALRQTFCQPKPDAKEPLIGCLGMWLVSKSWYAFMQKNTQDKKKLIQKLLKCGYEMDIPQRETIFCKLIPKMSLGQCPIELFKALLDPSYFNNFHRRIFDQNHAHLDGAKKEELILKLSARKLYRIICAWRFEALPCAVKYGRIDVIEMLYACISNMCKFQSPGQDDCWYSCVKAVDTWTGDTVLHRALEQPDNTEKIIRALQSTFGIKDGQAPSMEIWEQWNELIHIRNFLGFSPHGLPILLVVKPGEIAPEASGSGSDSA